MSADRLRTPPGRGRVYACPVCGNVALLQCFHSDTGALMTVAMPAPQAARLRRESGRYEPRRFVCDGCGYEGPFEVGMRIFPGASCARCSGRTERQVAAARSKVAS